MSRAMSDPRRSIAMTGALDSALQGHLNRPDGQEDLCLATYRPSTGHRRRSALLRDVVTPEADDRYVHGNASVTTQYVLRAAAVAAADDCGLVLLHSHPRARGWQQLSRADRKTEADFANLAREITGLPLVGMTLAGGDLAWSGRWWDRGAGRHVLTTECENVRVISDRLRVTWNDSVRPRPQTTECQVRTAHCWGDSAQEDLARLRVLVVGGGSVGLIVAAALAATGFEDIAVMDHDSVYPVNLDRLLHATRLDASLRRSKAEVACRTIETTATARHVLAEGFEDSLCEPAGLRLALDYDLIFSCVDRPWPRFVMNTLAYADLIPVIDGGIAVDPLPTGGMRGAIWRSHVVGPGRACLACNGQFHPSDVALERDGTLDDPSYIGGLEPNHRLRVRQNVAALSVACAGALLTQMVSLAIAPGGMGDPGPIRYHLAPHLLEHDKSQCVEGCPYQGLIGSGDARPNPAGNHATAKAEREARRAHHHRITTRTALLVARCLERRLRRLPAR